MLPINLKIEEAISILNYCSNWNVDIDTICMDLMDYYNKQGKSYIIIFDDKEQKFKTIEETQVDEYMG